MYNKGGWIANPRSWSIGFRPLPSKGTLDNVSNGLEVKILNERKVIDKKPWIDKILNLKLSGIFLDKEIKKPKKCKPN